MCSLVIYPGHGLGARHIPFRFDRTKANAPEAADAPLGRMMYVRWAPGSNRKVLEVDCVVPMTPVVTAALRAGFEAELDNVVRDNPGLGLSSFRMARPEPVREFSGSWITCFWFEQDDSLVCNGVECLPAAQVRMDDVNEMAIGSYYECTNGCAVAPSVGFACPGGGGGGVGEGGGPGEGGGGGGGNGGGEPSDHQLPDGGPAGFLEGCEVWEPQCDLAPLDSTMIELIEWAAQQLPPWARSLSRILCVRHSYCHGQERQDDGIRT